MLRGLTTIIYVAEDVAAAQRWYTDVLGVEAYFVRSAGNAPAYVEFRIGDYLQELGIVDARFAPHPRPDHPAGVVAYWAVDDIAASVDRLVGLGASVHEPTTVRGDGYVTASVVDPFGNVLGVMRNQHYLDVLAGGRRS
ncbi:VOC family protein [Pseudonocardia sp. NPDC049635]|uniref:VOC family protein n=1 Tax=Pseudonocardia sp. NPDC049635 TaxID=3155506 RepID=UPI0033E5C214